MSVEGMETEIRDRRLFCLVPFCYEVCGGYGIVKEIYPFTINIRIPDKDKFCFCLFGHVDIGRLETIFRYYCSLSLS